MAYLRYKMLQKYINGELQEIYKQGELIDSTEYSTYEECNEGNDNPDEPIEGNIYQWVDTSDTMCNGHNKYRVQKQQVSSDRGVTWRDTGETRQGDLIEVDSRYCTYYTMYLTFEALENGTFTFTGTNSNSVSYSIDDGQTWTPLASGVASPTVTRGNKIKWKGNCTSPKNSTYPTSGIGKFTSSGNFKVYGNIMSLVYGDNFENSTTISDYHFGMLFYNNTNVIDANNLILPSMTLASSCYYDMFGGCTSLVTAPQLPATTLASRCYEYMFEGCTSLITAPELPATTLVGSCYNKMFRICTSLTTAPALPATTLASSCYYGMFSGCTSLTTTPELPSTTLAGSCYYEMFRGCTSLTTTPELPSTTLANSCYYRMFYDTNLLPDCSNIDFTSRTVVASGGLKGLFSGTKVTDADLQRILPKDSNNRYWLPVTNLPYGYGCYTGMFSGCTSLTTAPILPATTLAESCYTGMFANCTSLTTAPTLPATTLADYCYNGMFSGCTSLTTAPTLPATTMYTECYREMFQKCTSLVTAPVLPATTLAQSCYWWMFQNCTNLTSITCLATDISASNCTGNWVKGVAANGTFTKNSSMNDWTTGDNGIPSGWTVQDA